MGYYLEAIQTLHGWLECKLRELFLMQRVKNNAPWESWAKAWDVSNEFTLNNAIKALFLVSAISEEEYSGILKFNRLRNNLVHKLFHNPYDEKWKGVKKEEFDHLFKIGVDLCYEVENKAGEINMQNNPSNQSPHSDGGLSPDKLDTST